MDDRMRISDADREQVTARLREHYAAGRLDSEELDERITAALHAKTYGDLRRVMTDLPEPAPAGADGGAVPPPYWAGPRWQGPPVVAYRRGPRLLPLALLVLFAAIILPPVGFVFFAFLKVILLIWLVTCVAGLFAAARFRRHVRRNWQGPGNTSWRGW
jgi:Domain of unknown function (DUF1707)